MKTFKGLLTRASRSQNATTVSQSGESSNQVSTVEFDLVVKDLEQHVRPHTLVPDTAKSVARKIVQYLTDKHNLSGTVNTMAFAQGDEANRTKVITQHAFAMQRAASLLFLQHSLLKQSHTQVLKHIEDTINFRKSNPAIANNYPEGYYASTFIKPLQQEAEQLKDRADNSIKQHNKATQQLEELRYVATKALMKQMKRCNQDYSNYFRSLQPSTLEQLTHTLHNLNDKSNSTADANAAVTASSRLQQHVSHRTTADDYKKLEFLEELYQQAQAARPMLETTLNEVKEQCLSNHNVAIKVEMAGLKAVERALEKSVEEYGGDFSQLVDITRGSIVCESIEDVVVVAKVLGELAAGGATTRATNSTTSCPYVSVEVVRIRNRLAEAIPVAAEHGGYRDVLINVRVWPTSSLLPAPHQQKQPQAQSQASSSHICEVQIQLEGFLKFNHSGFHRNYIEARSLLLLDTELGHVRVSIAEQQHQQQRVRRGVRAALDRVCGGSCRSLHLDHVQLNEHEFSAIHDALMSPACVVTEVWLPNCGLDKHTSRMLCVGADAVTDASTSTLHHQAMGLFRRVGFALNTNVSGECVGAFVSEELEELVLADCIMTIEDIDVLCNAMRSRTPRNLRILNLNGQLLGPEGTRQFASALQMMTQLTSLDLGLNHIGASGSRVLANSLLVMTSNTLEAEGMRRIAPALLKMTSMVTLKLCGNNIEDDGATAIAPSLATMSKLQTLELEDNNIGDDGAIAIALRLVRMANILDLGLGDNNIGDNGAIAIASSLAKLTSIHDLRLRGNSIGMDGIMAIVPSLAKMTALQKLDLSDKNLGDEDVTAIAPSLAKMTNLLTLDLRNNNIGANGAMAMSQSFAKLTKLQDLLLQGNHIGADGAIGIAPSLANMINLQTLGLRDNNIGANGATAIAPSLANMTSMQDLLLQGEIYWCA